MPLRNLGCKSDMSILDSEQDSSLEGLMESSAKLSSSELEKDGGMGSWKEESGLGSHWDTLMCRSASAAYDCCRVSVERCICGVLLSREVGDAIWPDRVFAGVVPTGARRVFWMELFMLQGSLLWLVRLFLAVRTLQVLSESANTESSSAECLLRFRLRASVIWVRPEATGASMLPDWDDPCWVTFIMVGVKLEMGGDVTELSGVQQRQRSSEYKQHFCTCTILAHLYLSGIIHDVVTSQVWRLSTHSWRYSAGQSRYSTISQGTLQLTAYLVVLP